jgi:hypothetical protein
VKGAVNVLIHYTSRLTQSHASCSSHVWGKRISVCFETIPALVAPFEWQSDALVASSFTLSHAVGRSSCRGGSSSRPRPLIPPTFQPHFWRQAAFGGGVVHEVWISMGAPPTDPSPAGILRQNKHSYKARMRGNPKPLYQAAA